MTFLCVSLHVCLFAAVLVAGVGGSCLVGRGHVEGMTCMIDIPSFHSGTPVFPQHLLPSLPAFRGMPCFGSGSGAAAMSLIGSGQQTAPTLPGGAMGQPALHQPSTPMFVSAPARSQRLLHSEAYLRYIEGLNSETSAISKWDQVLSVKKQDVRLTKEQESKLPSHWLKSKGAHKTMTDALWRLRDLMLRDTLNVCQTHH